MLSLCELRRALRLLEPELVGARVDRVVAPDALRLGLALHRRVRPDAHLLVCAEPDFARLGLVAERPVSGEAKSPFVALARARLRGARVAGVALLDDDRQAALRFETREGGRTLLLSILGPRSNLYLLDAEGRLEGVLRPLERTRRDLSLGDPWRSPEGRPPSEGEDRFAEEPDARYFTVLEAAYRTGETARHGAELQRRLERVLRRAADAAERKCAALARDAEAGAEAERLRRHGELLKGMLGKLRPRQGEARARDFASGEEVVIPLDPSLSPAANLDALFRRARKAERRAQRAVRDLGAAEARHAELQALREELASAAADPTDADAALRDFAERPELVRLLRRHAPQQRSAAAPRRAHPLRVGKLEVPRRLEPRRYRSQSGLEIWVGRSDEGNDLLTTRLARGKDLFFHLDASPGSHVVLRTGGRSDPPSEAVLEACELAVYFSKHRSAGRVDVLVAPIKNVRKPRGAKPGLVLVTGGRTVHLRRDRARLERVLAARVDEEA